VSARAKPAPRLDAAALQRQSLRAIVKLMPPALSEEMSAEWRNVAEMLSDDPAGLLAPPRRYRDLIFEYCATECQIRAYRLALKTINLEIYREKTPSGRDQVKVHPYVGLLKQALDRKFELSDLLERRAPWR
jgi:hypothetical protein